MSLFITPEFINSSKAFEPGFSLVVIKEVKDDLEAKDPAYKDTRIIFEGLVGPGNTENNVGRICSTTFFGKAISVGVRTVLKDVINLLCAVEKVKEEDLIGKEINFKKLVGKKLWIEAVEVTDKGKIYTNVVNYFPDDIVPF